MQTIPAFSYLLPAFLLFGVGAPAALIATLVFSLPPAIRLTALGIRTVPATSVEVADSFGTTSSSVSDSSRCRSRSHRSCSV